MIDPAPELLEGWTIYDHPLDYPDYYIARRWAANRDGTVTHFPTVYRTTSLSQLRAILQDENPGLTPVPRFPNDDPKIVEVWI